MIIIDRKLESDHNSEPWVRSSDKENNNPDYEDDFDDIYDKSNDDSQEELPETKGCVGWDDSQPHIF